MSDKPKSSKRILIAGVAVAALGAAGAGGYYLSRNGGDAIAKADQLTRAGDIRAAQIELRNAVRQNPGSAEAHLKLAQTQMALNDPVAAEKELKAARDLGTDQWSIMPMLGQAYMGQARYRDILTEIPAEAPQPDISARNLMLRSMAQVALNDIPAAKASLDQAETISPRNPQVFLTSSRLALALKDTATALTKADTALGLDPKLLEAILMKAQILAFKGDSAAAMTLMDTAVQLAPNSPAARVDRGNLLMIVGQDAKSKEDVDAILKLEPRNAAATYLNGVLLVRAAKYSDAAFELNKLGAMVARFPRALYFQAMAAANLGQTEQSIDFAQRYVARVPNDPDGVRLLAQAEIAAKRPERAAQVLTRAIAAGMDDAVTVDLLGRTYSMMGRTGEAVQSFQRATELAPTDPTILTRLASSQMQQGDAISAAASLERSVELAPQQPNAGEALVAAALSAGDIDKAEQALSKLRAQSGETEAVGILTGMVRLARLDLEGGRAAFAATAKQFPDSVNAKLNLGKVLVLQNRRAEGDAIIKEILAKDPANVPALNTYVQLLMGENKFAEAQEAVDAARKVAPTNNLFTAMSSDLLIRANEAPKAIAMLEAAKAGGELPPMLLSALGRAQAAAGMLDEAKTTFREVLKITPTDLDARKAHVDLLLALKDTEGANASLNQALLLSPGNIGIMATMVGLAVRTVGLEEGLKLANTLRQNPSNLPNSTVLKGDTLLGAQRAPEAVQAFVEEYKLQPTAVLALRLANASSLAGKDADAAKYLQDWLDRHPDDIDVTQVMSLLDMKAKRYGDAEKRITAILLKKPADTVSLNNLAWIYSTRGDKRARQLAQRAYLQAPTPETGDTLGWIMVQEGDAKSGLPLLQRAVEQRKDDPTLQYHLAVALRTVGQKDDAIKILQPLVSGPAVFDDKGAARSLLQELAPVRR